MEIRNPSALSRLARYGVCGLLISMSVGTFIYSQTIRSAIKAQTNEVDAEQELRVARLEAGAALRAVIQETNTPVVGRQVILSGYIYDPTIEPDVSVTLAAAKEWDRIYIPIPKPDRTVFDQEGVCVGVITPGYSYVHKSRNPETCREIANVK